VTPNQSRERQQRLKSTAPVVEPSTHRSRVVCLEINLAPCCINGRIAPRSYRRCLFLYNLSSIAAVASLRASALSQTIELVSLETAPFSATRHSHEQAPHPASPSTTTARRRTTTQSISQSVPHADTAGSGSRDHEEKNTRLLKPVLPGQEYKRKLPVASRPHILWAKAVELRNSAAPYYDPVNMKFSHSIQFNAIPDWSSHYIAYDNLKKLYVTPLITCDLPLEMPTDDSVLGNTESIVWRNKYIIPTPMPLRIPSPPLFWTNRLILTPSFGTRST
jgi:SPX domain